MRRVAFLAMQIVAVASAAAAGPSTDELIHVGARATGVVSVQKTGSVYRLRFVGDETLEYQINVADPMVARGILRVREATSDSYLIYVGGPGFRLAGVGEVTPEVLSTWSALTAESMTADSVILDYTDTVQGVHHRRHEFTIRGKSLRVRVRDLDENLHYESNYCGLLVGPMDDVDDWKYLPVQGTLATPMVYFRNGAQRFFAANLLDLYASNSSDWGLYQEPAPGSSTSSVSYNLYTFNLYKPLSGRWIGPRLLEPNAGTSNVSHGGYASSSGGLLAKPLDETLNITVSRFFREVLATPSQPASPYRDLLAGRTIMLMDGTDWSEYLTLWGLVQSWGMDQLAGYFWTSWTDSAVEGPVNTNAGPDWYPARDSSNFEDMVTVATAEGMLCGAYMTFSDMPVSAPPSVYYPSHIARNHDLSFKLDAFTGFPLITSTAAGIHARREAALAKTNYGITMAYLDIGTYGPPASSPEGDHVDQKAESSWAQTLGDAIAHQKQWMHDMQEIFEGPLLGEGSIATKNTNLEWVWGGACDSVQRCINTGVGIGAPQIPAGHPLAPTAWPVIPEFEWRVMSRLQANHGNGFPDRFFGPSDGPGMVSMLDGSAILPMTEAALDRYRLYEITYGKTAFLLTNGPYNGIGSYTLFADMIKEYYMMNALQSLYLEGTALTIRYMQGGTLRSFEEVMALTGTSDSFRDPQIKVQFTNNLELYLNHNPSPWVVTADGITYTIPEDGFVAVVPGTQFIAFSAIPPTTGGRRIDYCYAPNQYEFFDGRGAVIGYGGINTRESSNAYQFFDNRGSVTTHGGSDTRGIKRLKVRNFVHNRVVWETDSGEILTAPGPGPVPEPIRVDVLPEQGHPVPVGERRALKAIATYDNGAIRNVTTLVQWSSSHPLVAAVNDGAALTALANGQATVMVTSFQGAAVVPLVLDVQ